MNLQLTTCAAEHRRAAGHTRCSGPYGRDRPGRADRRPQLARRDDPLS
jgi:hypothetical protein